ncbi:helix-turn-helix transcriptional regulator [Thermostaphylospora chromogena]|uniref:Predicted DNA-binding transcriptional regulator YafY, contains an HTH and WYL domains n=1 Tax=Thermostaphylospora chromogena TaxID=35622 RepID=A0A1H1D1P6_9ACTN|nr:WYL domain-containing protein [Thermostaphylospora chromogena]SDQ70374.1 Predicted DNA-binding transcriptional regulator YafY, contains an HTH and WYL domains [Thermostaphylospora chromogena]
MRKTSTRLLRLLSLLQTRSDWTGRALAERLGVSERTIRNDVTKLRELGYPVHAVPGVAGGYRLGSGAAMPPLLLDDEEAVAVAVSLRTAAGGSVTGIEETALRALTKLEQVLPARLRPRVGALHTFTVSADGRGPTVDGSVLAAIAAACRDRRRLRFDYRRHGGECDVREVEPYRLVHIGRRWYLLAWDVGRGDWRTFRVDRIEPRVPDGPRFTPRRLPEEDVVAYVSRGVDAVLFRHRARVTVHAPAHAIAGWMPAAVMVEAEDERTCVVYAGADTPHLLAAHIMMLAARLVPMGATFRVDEPPELVKALRDLSTLALDATAR